MDGQLKRLIDGLLFQKNFSFESSHDDVGLQESGQSISQHLQPPVHQQNKEMLRDGEQVEHTRARPNPYTDQIRCVWSPGVLLYELLAEHPPNHLMIPQEPSATCLWLSIKNNPAAPDAE